MNTVLFDHVERQALLPFTFTRPVADIRVGILTLREKWERALNCQTSTVTEAYLSEKWPTHLEAMNLFVNPAFVPTAELIDQVMALKDDEKLVYKDSVVAFKAAQCHEAIQDALKAVELTAQPIHIRSSWAIFTQNAVAIERDFTWLTEGRKSAKLHPSVITLNAENIFVEEGAQLFNVSLNAQDGPIYIGKEAEVMEGTHVRGPFALCEHSTVKMGAKIYGGTTIGPHCKVGGEVSNSVFMGYSNKGHDGFLGNAVLGEWCNIGADSNNSNLKNNYAQVKLWDYQAERFTQTGLQFCGLMMGDHSKCGINTMFNTGTVVGVSSNIFGAGFPRNFIPSFSWGGSKKMLTYKTQKAYEVAKVVMKRRNIEFSDQDEAILNHVFEMTQRYRRD